MTPTNPSTAAAATTTTIKKEEEEDDDEKIKEEEWVSRIEPIKQVKTLSRNNFIAVVSDK